MTQIVSILDTFEGKFTSTPRMKRSLLLLCCLFFGGVSSIAQTLSGTFPAHANQTISLEGAKGLATYSIGSAKADEKG